MLPWQGPGRGVGKTGVIEPPPSFGAKPRAAVPSVTERDPDLAPSTPPARATEAPAPPAPVDPITERGDSLWRDFESQNGDGGIAVFLTALEDAEAMTDDLAFGMLSTLHSHTANSGNRTRFAELVGTLRERLPEVYDQSAHDYLWWCLVDALAEGRQELVRPLMRDLAARAGRNLDTFIRAQEALEYHGQLDVLVEAMRIAWPLVKSSDQMVPWGIAAFAEKGVSYEIYDHLEYTDSLDADAAVLHGRVRFFIEHPRDGYLQEFVGDLTGKSGSDWQVDDFALKRPRKRRREDRDSESEKEQSPDEGSNNLWRLINAFVGYLRREEGVPFPRGILVRHELYHYFLRRNEGDLDPRPSMLESAMHPNRKLPKPPRPAHPLCPERVTLDVHLAGLMGPLNGRYYSAAALFQAIPAWLRFLESRQLISADTAKKVAAELLPIHATLLTIWEKYIEDPALYRQGQTPPISEVTGG